jgi:polyhydroxyalkanoate synthesis repressor PhaR
MIVVKKYSNRRLYDTADSRYITLEDLAQKIRQGTDARVVDATSGEDLTQATLTQIILESRGAARLLPVPLLVRLIRMGDDALAEFFGRFVAWALDAYIHLKQGAQAAAPYNPFAALPFTASNALARLFGQIPWDTAAGMGGWGDPPVVPRGEPTGPHGRPPAEEPGGSAAPGAEPPRGAAGEAPRPTAGQENELAALRREMDELKRSLKNQRKTKKK